MERGELHGALRHRREPGAVRGRRDARPCDLLEGLDHLVVQDIFLTTTAELADVVLPAAAGWCESEGTVTNSERRVQRVRKALEPPGRRARRHRDHRRARAAPRPRLGQPDGRGRSGTSCARCRPMHARHELRAARGARRHPVALLRRGPSRRAVPARPAVGRARCSGPRGAVLASCEHEPPVDELDDEFPLRLTTGRRLDSYNTGVQTGGYASPLRRGETLDLSPEDAERARRRRRRARAGRLAARPVRGAGAHRPGAAARAWRS